MKKVFLLAVAYFLAFAFFALPAAASDLEINKSLSESRLTVSGSGATPDTLVSVFILEAIADPEGVGITVFPSVAEAELAGADGSFSLSIELSAALTTGQYKIDVRNGAKSYLSDVFTYINPSELSDLTEAVNTASQAATVQARLEQFQIVLRLPDVEFASEYILKARPKGGYTDSSLNTELQRSAALYLLKSGEPAESISPYSDTLCDAALEIDCYAQYAGFSGATRDKFLDLLSKTDIMKPDALEIIYGAGLTAAACEAQSWQELKAVLHGDENENNYFRQRIAAGTRYYELKFPETVFRELFRQRSGLTDIEDLISEFKKAADGLYADENKQSSPKGGGSGGRSSSSGGTGAALWGAEAGKVLSEQTDDTISTKQPVRFNDISGHWAEKQIVELADAGVVSGYPDGSFAPEGSVTRAEFIKLVCALFDTEGELQDIELADVEPSAWYAEYVRKAMSAGFIKGDTSGLFRPNDAVTRQDAAVILCRVLGLAESDISGKFKDSDAVSGYAAGFVSAMFDSALISGMEDGSFRPLEKTTRAQAAVMLLGCRNYRDQGGAR